ncbi:hypothetical protein [Gemmatimonas sp.]|uniref:hypothetical protein n=1 Tax=Gemmatimonas sp. TaxID=1962908 RepID=UPI0025B999C8|nr:hypothetical protein [Gemmatimonas sp.]MCA2992865.1 hypothetical protein [Gemmatimonas sp.]
MLRSDLRARLERVRDDLEVLQDVNLGDLLGGSATGPLPGTVLTPAGDFAGVAIRATDLGRVLGDLALTRPGLPRADALDFVATAAIEALRKAVPGSLPLVPIPEGRKGAAIPVGSGALGEFVRLAAIRRLGGNERAVWDDGVNELLVDAAGIVTVVTDGQVRIEIPVVCDQVKARMQVPFAVGSAARVAGMVMATADRPAGDALVARIWGEALIAFAHGALLDATESLAGASGRDLANARLVPRAISAWQGQVTIETQAAFRIEGRKP